MPGVGNKYFQVNFYPKYRRIMFLDFVGTTTNEEGIEHEVWKRMGERWAYVEHRNGSAKWANGVYSDKVTDLFRINYDFGFTPTTSMVVLYKGNVFEIESVDNIREENKEVEVRAIQHIRKVGNAGKAEDNANIRFG